MSSLKCESSSSHFQLGEDHISDYEPSDGPFSSSSRQHNTRRRIETLKLCRQCVFLQQKEPWQGQDWPDLPSSLWCCLCITEEPFFSEGKKLFQSFKSLFVIPFQHFLTVGDWSAKVWSEDIKGSPIMWTRKIGTKSPTSYQLTFPSLLHLCSAIMSLSPTYIH